MQAEEKQKLRQAIAQALWEADREKSWISCSAPSLRPICIPKLALSADINSAHYGYLADKVIEAISESKEGH